MYPIRLHGRELDSVFDLLGTQENDITYSLGWVLSRSPRLMKALLLTVIPIVTNPKGVRIALQKWSDDGGFTDLEIEGQAFHLIVEAKRNWLLPSRAQLQKYRKRLRDGVANLLAVVSECSPEYAGLYLPEFIDGVKVEHVSWRELYQKLTPAISGAARSEKYLLQEFRSYLRGVMSVQDQESNRVYVVSLANKNATGSFGAAQLTWIDIVERYDRYVHPFGWGHGWPTDPPNYLGFRYSGKLQSIRHVEGYEVIDNFYPYMKEFPNKTVKPPKIVPAREVKMGKLYPSGRVWAALDLLLTSETISEARDKTRERLGNGQG